ncbi:transcriptional regulator (plasmid) [Diaphorobacter sp. HDW4A]|uniref:helix-turn-helix domain-containing protein n=1 Tax=Diaphorobacter sp. HDW4A TaxID=2714924 RepID=UPI00140C1207|nr:transcriptional regulator [Diaphorobacter sp. HDW4A]QIL84199.1 transcriptional regulator [Diaphorobacter sp. HDW4A]
MKYQLQPIRTNADYKAALKAAEAFFDAAAEPSPGSNEEAVFEALVTLIEAYEKKHYPIELPTPIDAIKFRMEQGGMTVADMAPYIGPSNRVYEVLKGTRKLSVTMIRRLMTLGIPADVLIGQEPPAHA